MIIKPPFAPLKRGYVSRLRAASWPRVAAVFGLVLGIIASPVMAQDSYPSRTIRIIVPWAVGTPPDVAARVVANKLPELLKQPVVVENKPGASGTIGISEMLRAPADGYTIGALHFATATVASLYPQFKADLGKDIVGLGQIEWGHNVLVVSPGLNVKSLNELVDYIRKNPATYASSGVGTPAHLSGLTFLRTTNLQGSHVPYNNLGQAVSDVSTGRVTFMVLAAPAAVPQVLGGKLKALAITAPTRNPQIKDVPTVSELKMPGMQSRTWSGLVVRADTPKNVVDRLSRDIASVMAMPDVQQSLLRQQAEIPTETAEQFRTLIRRDTEYGVNFVRDNSLRVE